MTRKPRPLTTFDFRLPAPILRLMLKPLALVATLAFSLNVLSAAPATVLFDGSSLDQFEFQKGGWVIEDGAMSCRMQEVKDRKGNVRLRGMGYIWTKKDYSDFVLTLSYKLSEAANSGVFFRTDKDNAVQGGFEIQLLDDAGYAKKRGKAITGKNSNGALYDAQPPAATPGKAAGKWNTFKLSCKGPKIQVEINGTRTVTANIDQWTTANKNPDGSPNKFKTALKDLPRTGRIGFQNHGQVVWIKDVKIRDLSYR